MRGAEVEGPGPDTPTRPWHPGHSCHSPPWR
jgi:hypothetical protein